LPAPARQATARFPDTGDDERLDALTGKYRPQTRVDPRPWRGYNSWVGEQMTAPGRVHVGQAAKATGTTARTIRYYEELGLLQPMRTAARGARLYSPAELRRIHTIKRLQAFGFALSEIREMLTARSVSPTGQEAAGKIMERLRGKIREADEKIAAFQQSRGDLQSTLDLVMHWCGECSREPRKECAVCAAVAEGQRLEIGREFFL